MIPKDEFWHVMEAYGVGIWPVQIVFYVAGIFLVTWLLLKPGRLQTLFTKLYLSIAFGWNGIVFYCLLARDMAGDSYGNYVFGAVFIITAVLFVVDVFRQRMWFSPPTAGWRKYATPVLALSVFSYPLLGVVFGHRFPSLITPGAFPCPTTALGLVLLTTALPKVDRVIYVLLLICAIPFTPFVQIARYGVYEDAILFAVGIYGLVLLLWLLQGIEMNTGQHTDGQHR